MVNFNARSKNTELVYSGCQSLHDPLRLLIRLACPPMQSSKRIGEQGFPSLTPRDLFFHAHTSIYVR